jgi:hypothetical protein
MMNFDCHSLSKLVNSIGFGNTTQLEPKILILYMNIMRNSPALNPIFTKQQIKNGFTNPYHFPLAQKYPARATQNLLY